MGTPFPSPGPTQQPTPHGGSGCLHLTINPDEYPDEISWTLYDGDGRELIKKDYPQSAEGFNHCFAGNTCWVFVMQDAYDNGICCDYGVGDFVLYWDGQQVYKEASSRPSNWSAAAPMKWTSARFTQRT